ncbi:MAG: DEAD/DEAH box helicase family protein [Candidatus Nanopelagicales bacterium]
MAEFKFDANQKYQKDAVLSVVDLFEGQPADAAALATTLTAQLAEDVGDQGSLLGEDYRLEIGAVGNNLLLDDEAVLQNLQAVQDRNGLEVVAELADGGLDFDVEMETGTGKTYVYLRTIFELSKRYNFTKFVILVPSVPIKEGVISSIQAMEEHFRQLYAEPFDATVYSGKTAEEVQSFATSTSVQILVMTIDSVRGDKNTRIIHQNRDKLNGLRPIDYLATTRPVVIMDEPQNMESDLSKSAVGELNPLCTLRYSATHRKKRNVVYRLDPVDAHDLGLVKEIVVADVLQAGADAKPYIKLLGVKREPTFQAKLELAVRKESDGSLDRRAVWVKHGQDLADVTGNAAYSNNWRVNEISYDPQSVELTNDVTLYQGDSVGGSNDAIYREMIRETIREHLRKEVQMRDTGIKVLSLFFVPTVASYLGDGTTNDSANGDFVKWFDELFEEERNKSDRYKELLPNSPTELRRAYFSALKKRGGEVEYIDTTGATAKDDDAYDLIMKDKARLLDPEVPVRFIFSHSALREGWDNPNVFQICTLREMKGADERRQTIGRGLRLPVAKSDEGYERVPDRSIAQLTVVANESYQEFAKSLQSDYVKAGVSIGHVRPGEFAKIPTIEEGIEKLLGFNGSELIWTELKDRGFIDKDGKVQSTYQPNLEGFSLGPVPDFFWPETEIHAVLDKCKIEHFVKTRRKRVPLKLNKELYASAEFEEFWDRISRRTTYRVSVKRAEIIDAAVVKIKAEPTIQPLRVQVTKAGVKIVRGGTKTEEKGQRSTELVGTYELPDIVTELQAATSLTRKTLVDILLKSERMGEFIHNPNDFIQMVKRNLLNVLSATVVEGIQYEKIAGYIYELRELQKDGKEERDRFLDQMYKVKNTQKTDFDYIPIDSTGPKSPERQFAEKLDSREDIKVFMKLPAKFKIPTPVGDYNPDWAIVKVEEGEERLYLIRETKSTADWAALRPTEQAKINSAKKHFEAIGVNYAKSSPEDWGL